MFPDQRRGWNGEAGEGEGEDEDEDEDEDEGLWLWLWLRESVKSPSWKRARHENACPSLLWRKAYSINVMDVKTTVSATAP